MELTYLTPKQNAFEEAYIKAREEENRVYSSDEIRSLPYLNATHDHYDEWKLRIKSTERFIDYIKNNNINNLIYNIKPNEIYNLGAQSHVGVSFENPEYTAEVSGIGTLRVLEAIRFLKMKNIKFYQASTSELFGEKYKQKTFNEQSKFHPKSPYGVAKIYSYWITSVYRESYNIFACNGILFNHESPRRGETFVTRKITRFLTRKKLGSKDILYLGNLNAKRDWGHAKDFVEALVESGIIEQDADVDFLKITKPVVYTDEEKDVEVVGVPYDGFKTTFTIQYNLEDLDVQYSSIHNMSQNYKLELQRIQVLMSSYD